MISGEICKSVLKLDFTAHGIMEYLSELGNIETRGSIQKEVISDFKHEKTSVCQNRFGSLYD